jgi:hypothetical protein
VTDRAIVVRREDVLPCVIKGQIWEFGAGSKKLTLRIDQVIDGTVYCGPMHGRRTPIHMRVELDTFYHAVSKWRGRLVTTPN